MNARGPSSFALTLFSAVALLAGGPAVRGQSALDGFNPTANNVVLAIVMQPDGKIVIGGGFTTLSPNGTGTVTRNRIARLNLDGTLDSGFDPTANGDVNTVAVQPDGKILVGGFFTSVAGQTRNRIARLNPDGTLDTAFNPNANGVVRSIAMQADGKILVGGQFTTIGGQTRNRIARLNPDGTLDTGFDPNANNTVFSIVVQTDGKILVGGFFNGANSIGGQARNRIARLDPATGLADSFNPNASGAVFAIALQTDGRILAGGDFNGANSIGGQTRNRIARLDADTGVADSFNPNANFGVFTIAVQADGKILAGGDFNGANSIGGQARNNIARLDPITGAADSLDPHANALASIYSITVQPDRKILVGGNFSTLAPNGGAAVTRNNIARLETDGRLDQTLNLNVSGAFPANDVYAIAVQVDGKILIGGNFTSVLGVTRNHIARVNPDGTLDTGFDPNVPDGFVFAMAVQADGKILVGGNFKTVGGQPRNTIARLTTSGSVDSFNPNATNAAISSIAVQADGNILVGGTFTNVGGLPRNNIARLDPATGLADSFDPNASSSVDAITVQADGKILVGGHFIRIGGQARRRIARLNQDGTADSFDANANGDVRAIAIQADGRILAGGFFTSIGGAARNHIARLDPTTGAADSFDPNANDFVFSIAVQADGKILAGGSFNGSFTSIGGAPRNYIARLEPTTGSADSFDPNASAVVASIALQADGKVLAGGSFTNIGGQTRSFFARLSNNTGALQDLVVSQSTVTWTRGGSSPQFTRVTFDSSTNNLNYTPLGNGTPAGSNWTLPGLNLLTGQNLYIRARGLYRSGQDNGSESITESVWNVFIVARPALNIQLSAATNVLVSWATNFTAFTLEVNTNLNTNVWSVVSAVPVINGTNNIVTNAADGSARFYRLRK